MKRAILPVKTIVSRLGGQTALGKMMSLRQSVVGGWVSRNTIPSRRIPEIIAAAARLDPPVHLRPDDFFDLPAAQSCAPPTAAQQPSP